MAMHKPNSTLSKTFNDKQERTIYTVKRAKHMWMPLITRHAKGYANAAH